MIHETLPFNIDLNSFRAALSVLQQQVAQLDQLKAEYYTEVLAHEEETWDMVMGKVCLILFLMASSADLKYMIVGFISSSFFVGCLL